MSMMACPVAVRCIVSEPQVSKSKVRAKSRRRMSVVRFARLRGSDTPPSMSFLT